MFPAWTLRGASVAADSARSFQRGQAPKRRSAHAPASRLPNYRASHDVQGYADVSAPLRNQSPRCARENRSGGRAPRCGAVLGAAGTWNETHSGESKPILARFGNLGNLHPGGRQNRSGGPCRRAGRALQMRNGRVRAVRAAPGRLQNAAVESIILARRGEPLPRAVPRAAPSACRREGVTEPWH